LRGEVERGKKEKEGGRTKNHKRDIDEKGRGSRE
jgi:hypothetical protein